MDLRLNSLDKTDSCQLRHSALLCSARHVAAGGTRGSSSLLTSSKPAMATSALDLECSESSVGASAFSCRARQRWGVSRFGSRAECYANVMARLSRLSPVHMSLQIVDISRTKRVTLLTSAGRVN